jgi:hypothetical protein
MNRTDHAYRSCNQVIAAAIRDHRLPNPFRTPPPLHQIIEIALNTQGAGRFFSFEEPTNWQGELSVW